MRLSANKHFRALRYTFSNPVQFFFRSSIIRWSIVLLLIGVSLATFKGPYFRLSKISCINQEEKECDPVVMAELENHRGRSIFTINTKSIEEKLEKANPSFQNVAVVTKLPHELIVTMVDKVEYTHLKIASSSAIFLVDQNLRIVDKTQNPNAGKFTIQTEKASEYGVGDRIEDDVLVKVFELGRLLQMNYLSFSLITVGSPTYVVIDLPESKKAVFTTTKDLSRQVTSLQLILSKATITKEPREYDMRFDKPVLK